MEFVAELWVPILVATFVLWFLSFAAWVLLPHHFGDHQKLANEDELMELLKRSNVPAGNYMFPYAGSSKTQSDKAFIERYTEGPRGVLDVYRVPNMAVNMVQTILYFLVTVFTIAYITSVACPPGTEFMKVFRIAGTIGVLTYASSGFLNRIWFKARRWTHVLDGAVYGVVVGLIFGLLWN